MVPTTFHPCWGERQGINECNVKKLARVLLRCEAASELIRTFMCSIFFYRKKRNTLATHILLLTYNVFKSRIFRTGEIKGISLIPLLMERKEVAAQCDHQHKEKIKNREVTEQAACW